MNLSIQSIEKILRVQSTGEFFDGKIDNVSIDSRSLQNNEKTLFFALVGPNNDAHIYISSIIEKAYSILLCLTFLKDCQAKLLFW